MLMRCGPLLSHACGWSPLVQSHSTARALLAGMFEHQPVRGCASMQPAQPPARGAWRQPQRRPALERPQAPQERRQGRGRPWALLPPVCAMQAGRVLRPPFERGQGWGQEGQEARSAAQPSRGPTRRQSLEPALAAFSELFCMRCLTYSCLVHTGPHVR